MLFYLDALKFKDMEELVLKTESERMKDKYLVKDAPLELELDGEAFETHVTEILAK